MHCGRAFEPPRAVNHPEPPCSATGLHAGLLRRPQFDSHLQLPAALWSARPIPLVSSPFSAVSRSLALRLLAGLATCLRGEQGTSFTGWQVERLYPRPAGKVLRVHLPLLPPDILPALCRHALCWQLPDRDKVLRRSADPPRPPHTPHTPRPPIATARPCRRHLGSCIVTTTARE